MYRWVQWKALREEDVLPDPIAQARRGAPPQACEALTTMC